MIKTKAQIISDLKAEYPELKVGNDEEYKILSDSEYDSTIKSWAENELSELAKQAEAEAKATAKAALLSKLGITADEAALLLG